MNKLNKDNFYDEILSQRNILSMWVKKNYIAEEDDLKDLYKTSVYETIKTIIRDIDFIEFLHTSKNFEDEIFYPSRSIYENCLRIRYIRNISENQQQELATKELLRLSVRYYDTTEEESFKNIFNKISNGKYKNIGDFRKINDAFPNIKKMITKTEISKTPEKIDEEYFLYQGLCEASHGKNMSRKKDSNFYGFVGMVYKSLDDLIICIKSTE